MTSRKMYLISDLNRMRAISQCPSQIERGFYIEDGFISTHLSSNLRKFLFDLELSFKAFETGVLVKAEASFLNISVLLQKNQVKELNPSE